MSQAGFHPLGLHLSLPVLHPKISMLHSDDTHFSYGFLLAGSRQFFLQGFADILQMSP